MAIVVVSFLHYETATAEVWLHQLFQRAYYVPILLAALWYGWRGGLLAGGFAGVLYLPHIVTSWTSHPEYRADQFVEILMFIAIGALTGVLAEHERAQRLRVEETARKLSEVYGQLQTSFEQLRRADRLSALGELSAGLAHEIRNPLGSIEGAVQILGRQELADDTRKEFTELARKEVLRLKGLLTNFLEFARPQPPQRVPTDPRLLLQSVSQLAADTAAIAGVSFRLECPVELPPLAADPEQIKQVLLNLVLNAIQAMPRGGQIVLRANRETEGVRLEVQDEGSGIAAEEVEKVFDPFYTTRAGGTGLGLSIAYQIVSRHGGHISVRTNPERGMTFSIDLPADVHAAAVEQPTWHD